MGSLESLFGQRCEVCLEEEEYERPAQLSNLTQPCTDGRDGHDDSGLMTRIVLFAMMEPLRIPRSGQLVTRENFGPLLEFSIIFIFLFQFCSNLTNSVSVSNFKTTFPQRLNVNALSFKSASVAFQSLHWHPDLKFLSNTWPQAFMLKLIKENECSCGDNRLLTGVH